jgi:hypothetical protein
MLLKRAIARFASFAQPLRLLYTFSRRAKDSQLILHSQDQIEQMLIRK